MKRLITGVITTLLSLIVLTVPAFAAERFTRTTISNPTTTSNRNLNIAFQVFSSLETDDQFAVQLFENTNLKASQEIVHPNGDSGVFSVTIPATGTYSYFVRSINHDNADTSQESSIVSVQVTDAPQPIVTTVNTSANSGTAGGQSGTSGSANSAGETNGQVGDAAASTEKDPNEVLGDSDKTGDDKKDKSQSWGNSIGVILLLLAIASGYYYMVMRNANKD